MTAHIAITEGTTEGRKGTCRRLPLPEEITEALEDTGRPLQTEAPEDTGTDHLTEDPEQDQVAPDQKALDPEAPAQESHKDPDQVDPDQEDQEAHARKTGRRVTQNEEGINGRYSSGRSTQRFSDGTR